MRERSLVFKTSEDCHSELRSGEENSRFETFRRAPGDRRGGFSGMTCPLSILHSLLFALPSSIHHARLRQIGKQMPTDNTGEALR